MIKPHNHVRKFAAAEPREPRSRADSFGAMNVCQLKKRATRSALRHMCSFIAGSFI